MPAPAGGGTVKYKSKSSGVSYHGTYSIGASLSSEPWGAFELLVTLSDGTSLKGLLASNNNDGGPGQDPA